MVDVDSHAWYFELSSFRQAIDLLRALGKIDFGVLRLYPTRIESDEFWVILEAGGGRSSAGAAGRAATLDWR